MKPSDHFHFCPRCGAKQPAPPHGGLFNCAACNFILYFNAAIATAAFIAREDGRLLLIRRAKEPEQGKLAPPGGFVDIGEEAEQAIRREIREEVGLEVSELVFLCSQPNSYDYKGVVYPVLDFFFTARALAAEQAQALDDSTASSGTMSMLSGPLNWPFLPSGLPSNFTAPKEADSQAAESGD